MKHLKIQIKLDTPCLVGSGTGYGSIIDTDIVFDDMGIPYIPAKRVKGCLRDSAMELLEAFELAGITLFKRELIDKTFGLPGQEEPAIVYFSDLVIEDYNNIKRLLKVLINEEDFNRIINPESILSYFTEIRQQTAIDETQVAKPNFLRTIRVLKKDIVFEGPIEIAERDEEILKVLSLSALNLRHMGTKRTKGFGFITCRLFENDRELNYINELEELCRD